MNFGLSLIRPPPLGRGLSVAVWGGGEFLSLRESLNIKSYPSTMPRTVLNVCGGWWVVGGWLRPILVFSLSLDQAEENEK